MSLRSLIHARVPPVLQGRAVRLALVAAFGLWNTYWLYQLAMYAADGLPLNDWSSLSSLDPAMPYATEGFHWSVPAAWLWAYAVVPLGFGFWCVLHLVALATLPWKVALLALVTFPFWADVEAGNMLTFAVVLAWHALAGRRWAVVGFVILAALIPRPVMLPALAWLLWRSWPSRIAFAAAAAVVVVAGLATGTLGTWINLMLGTSSSFWYTSAWSIGPSSLVGVAWVPIGLALGVLATWRGHLGLASLAVSPYLIHYYAVFALLELRAGDAARPVIPQKQVTMVPAQSPPAPPPWVPDREPPPP